MTQPAEPLRYDTSDQRLARLGAGLEHAGNTWRLHLPARYDGAHRTVERKAAARGWLPEDLAAFVAPLAGAEPVLPVNGTRPSAIATVTPVGVVGMAFANSVERFVHHEGHVRLGDDDEAVHQARISIRRLRADLRTFAPTLDAAIADALRRDLVVIADTLGNVRDADVLTTRLERRVAKLGDEVAGGSFLIERARAQRRSAQADLLGVLTGPAYVTLLERLWAAPAILPQPHRRRDLAGLARMPWRRLQTSVRQLGPAPSAPELHAVRLQVKRARYAAEAVTPAAGKRMRRFARALAGLQDVLGDHHDAVEAAAWLRRAAVSEPAAGFVAGLLVAEESAAEVAAMRAWRDRWRAAERRSPWR